MKAPARWERQALAFRDRVQGIQDEGVRLAVAVILEALNDGEDDCGFAVFAPSKDLHVEGFALDEDLVEAICARVGEATMRAAVQWLQGELAGQDHAWVAWLLHRVKVPSHPGMQEIVSHRDGVIYDIQKKSITKRLRR